MKYEEVSRLPEYEEVSGLPEYEEVPRLLEPKKLKISFRVSET